MPIHPNNNDDDDEALAEALADAWVAQAEHNPALRRLALRAVGHLRQAADLTPQELACELGTDGEGLKKIARRALQKLRLCPQLHGYFPTQKKS